MADGNLIGIVTTSITGARRDSAVALHVAFSFGAQQMLEGSSSGLLVLYDLDQYTAHQRTLAGGGETTDELFNGQKRVFDFPPDHRVAAGTGVLFMANVKFKSRKLGSFTESFVTEVSGVQTLGSKALELRFQCKNAVNSQGRPQSPEVVDLDTIVTAGPAVEDFNAFTELGDATRKLTFRLLKADLSEVLVSQMNPRDCNQSAPIKIRYEASAAARKVGAPAQEPPDAPPPKKSRMPFDLTGEYAQLRDPDDNPDNLAELVTPGVLRIHHIGRAVCGWFSPLPPEVLSARTPNTLTAQGALLFDPPFPVFSDSPMIFAMGKQLAANPPTFAVTAKFGSGAADPDELFAKNDDGFVIPDADLTSMQLRLLDPEPTDAGPVFRRIQLRVSPSANGLGPDPQVFGFRRISSSARMAFSTLQQLLDDTKLAGKEPELVRDALLRSVVEPTPPGVLGRLISMIASPQMDELIRLFSEAAPGSARIFPAEEVARALENLAESLKSLSGEGVLSPSLIVLVRNAARAHDVVLDGKTTDMLSALQIISDEIVEAELAKNPQHTRGSVPVGLEETLAELSTKNSFRGFAAFNIRPARGILYKFEFNVTNEKPGNLIVLSGSLGSFVATISKLDRVTGNNIDRDDFRPTEFFGMFIAGALGVGVTLESATKGKPEASFGATIGPMTAQVISFSNIPVRDFEGAQFSLFASSASASLKAGPFAGGGATRMAAVFSLSTTGAVPVTLEVEINKRFEVKAKSVQFKDLAKAAEDLDDARTKKKELSLAGASAMLTLASLCKGILVRDPLKAAPRAEKQFETAEGLSERPLELNARVLATQFSRESAAIDADGRQMLELRLAVLRKLLEYPGWMDIEGTTSPEWTDSTSREQAAQKNARLSLRRAQATRSAIFAAAGDPGESCIPLEKDIRAQGKGAEPWALRDPLRLGFRPYAAMFRAARSVSPDGVGG